MAYGAKGTRNVESGEHRNETIRSTSRRGFLAVAGAGATLSLAGCVGDGNGDGDQLRAALAGGPGDRVDQLLDDYVMDEAGVDVETSILPYDQLFETMTTNLEQENTEFDIVMMDDPWLPRLANNLEPIEDYIDDIPRDQLIDTTIDIGTWPPTRGGIPPESEDLEPQLRALCAVGNTQLFVINERHYEEVGHDAPETWQDVYEAGQDISEQIEGTDGYVIRGQRGNPIMANFFGLGMSIVGDMFDEDWRYSWNDEEGIEACRFYTRDLRSISPEGVASFDSDEVVQRLADGRAAAGPAWPATVGSLVNEDESEEYDNIRSLVMPKGQRRAPQQGNWMLGINTHVDDSNKEDAAQIIREFVSEEAQERYVELGGVPFRHDTFENNMGAQPWFPALYESLQTAQWRPRTQEWNEIEVTQGRQLNTALVGETEPEEAMNTAGEEIEAILEDSGYYE
jgi:multiple sugar transport system substrate-binding protein